MVSHATNVHGFANFDSIDKINEILVGKLRYSSIPSNVLEELETFGEKFLSCICCEDHEVATKLAKLSVCLYTQPNNRDYAWTRFDKIGTRDQSVLSILSEKTLQEKFSINQELEREGRLIFPATPIDFGFFRQRYIYTIEELHRSGNPRFSMYFNRWKGKEGMIRPLFHRVELTGNGSWWQGDIESDEFEFRVRSTAVSIAEFCWIRPEIVNTYLGFILEEQKPRYWWHYRMRILETRDESC